MKSMYEGLKSYLKLLALKDVAVSTARLTGSAGDGSIETASAELRLKRGVDFGVWKATLSIRRGRSPSIFRTLLPLLKLALDVGGLLGRFLAFSGLSGGLGALLGYGLSVLAELRNIG